MLPSLRMAFVIFVAALIDIRGSEAQQAPYPDPPQVLVDEVGRGVDAVLDAETDGDDSPASEFESMWNTIFLDAVTDAERDRALIGGADLLDQFGRPRLETLHVLGPHAPLHPNLGHFVLLQGKNRLVCRGRGTRRQDLPTFR